MRPLAPACDSRGEPEGGRGALAHCSFQLACKMTRARETYFGIVSVLGLRNPTPFWLQNRRACMVSGGSADSSPKRP